MQNPDRDFVLKVSALEIYNEVVKDLLTSDNTPLRLLDDKEVSLKFLQYFTYRLNTYGEFLMSASSILSSRNVIRYFVLQRGTIVEKLKEEVVRNVDHLRQVIKICEGILLNILTVSYALVSSCRISIDSFPLCPKFLPRFPKLYFLLVFISFTSSEAGRRDKPE